MTDCMEMILTPVKVIICRRKIWVYDDDVIEFDTKCHNTIRHNCII